MCRTLPLSCLSASSASIRLSPSTVVVFFWSPRGHFSFSHVCFSFLVCLDGILFQACVFAARCFSREKATWSGIEPRRHLQASFRVFAANRTAFSVLSPPPPSPSTSLSESLSPGFLAFARATAPLFTRRHTERTVRRIGCVAHRCAVLQRFLSVSHALFFLLCAQAEDLTFLRVRSQSPSRR